MLKLILHELKEHTPFTVVGAISGIVLMMFFQKIPFNVSHEIFYVLHPMHVVLSALVTSSMYKLYKCGYSRNKRSLLMLLIVGYVGAVGVATLSDSLIPYLGEVLLRLPNRGIHIGFIEKWWLINPLAIAGVALAYFRPSTKFPHAVHVLLSTWASLFHMLMASGEGMSLFSYFVIFLFLFLAVWLPCCISDIVFPLLFVNSSKNKPYQH